jgi:hypothetical protein
MKIGSIKIDVSNNSLNNENTKLISFNETYVYFEYKSNNNINHKRCFLENAIQRYAIFELINNSPLWSLDISSELTGTYFRNLANIIIDDSLIQEYLDKSMALNLVITSYFNNSLKRFVKFDDNKSYYPKFNMIEPTNIKIKLYDYQKKSLAKIGPSSMPKSKPPGVGIDIQGKTPDNYKIRIAGARSREQLEEIIAFIKVLLYYY